MHRRLKKQRHPIHLEQVNDIGAQKDLFPDNSSSIMSMHVQSHEQPSIQNLIVSPNTNVIKVQPKKTLSFQQEQQEQQNEQHLEKDIQQYEEYPNKQSPYRKKQKPQQRDPGVSQKKQNKETVSTYTSNQNIKQVFQQQKSVKQKVETQHYQYNREQSFESQQQDSQQQQMQEETPKRKLFTVSKTFIADSFEDLIFAQIPPKCKILCAINFNHQFLSIKRNYDLYLVSQKKYLLSTEKTVLKLTSHFHFFNKKAKSKQLYGQLKSNFTGLQYVVNKYQKRQDNQDNHDNHVSQLCWVGYDSNIFGLASQRGITVLKNQNAKLEKIPYFSKIKNYYENGITNKFQKFVSRKAVPNKNGQYQLDFKGKVNNPSVTNFILTDLKDQECILFGKRNKTTYILQIGYPFSIFQGFAVAVSNLDRKLCVR